MKTLRPLTTPLLRAPLPSPTTSLPCRATLLTPPTNHNRNHRTFLTNPFTTPTEPQRISGTRTLPYPPSTIFSIICDVGNYKHYYPFCLDSLVTKTSRPAAVDGKTYPEEAKLVVGWAGSAQEEFWSRVYCVPFPSDGRDGGGGTVEAVSGATETTLEPRDFAHHNPRPVEGEDRTRAQGLLEHLLTRWTVVPRGKDGGQTEVRLAIEWKFANPVYAVVSQSALDARVTEKIIEAFEKRVGVVVGENR